MAAPTPVWPARVDDRGTLHLEARDRFLAYVKTLAGQVVEVVVRKPKQQRTLQQNAYWWSTPVRILAEHCGYTDTQMHYALLGECFGYTEGPTGQPVPNEPSSSDLSVEKFAHLIDWTLTWAMSELGVYIPEPNRRDAAAVD